MSAKMNILNKRRQETTADSKQKDEDIFGAPPYCQIFYCAFALFSRNFNFNVKFNPFYKFLTASLNAASFMPDFIIGL